MIPRLVQQMVIRSLERWNKVVVVLGPRQSGKTTMLKELQTTWTETGKKVTYFNCDTAEDLEAINTNSLTILGSRVKNADYLLVDEAQQLTNPGLTFKIIHDNFPQVKVIVTGSSSFELRNRMSDAMTGRYVDFMMYPLSLVEVVKDALSGSDVKRLADEFLLYGGYPEVYVQSQPELKKSLLATITESYLFKDILAYSGIRNTQAVKDLTRALAYQIGAEVNENELAGRIKIDRKTLLSYLEILEKAFVIYRLYPYSKNPRREIGRRYKVYFVDLGIRNALIGDFNSPTLRSDIGGMWENLLIIERIKNTNNKVLPPQSYFWRNYGGAEVDYLEIGEGKVKAWEFKSGNKLTASKGAKSFTASYHTPVSLINRENFWKEFLCDA